MYSLDEVLGLFDLKYNITIDDLKRAKKKVLMLHPDKSKLSSENSFHGKSKNKSK